MPSHFPQWKERREAVVKALCAILFKAKIPREGGGLGILKSSLNTLVYKYSEAVPYRGGTHLKVPTWTLAAARLYKRDKKNFSRRVNLEHVAERKYLVQALLQVKSERGVRRVLKLVETCVVTKKEHRKLKSCRDPKGPNGFWQRYLDAKIEYAPNPYLKAGTTSAARKKRKLF